MASDWYYKVLGDVVGPSSQADLLKAINKGVVQEDTMVRLGERSEWQAAASVNGLMDAARRQATEQARIAEERQARDQQRRANMRVSTSGLPPGTHFRIVDTIFAFDSQGKAGIFGGSGDPHTAFAGVKQNLLAQAYAIGADGVINCQFEYRVAVAGEGIGAQQAVEIFAYGTAVKLVTPDGTWLYATKAK
ncbi:hypothetical protein Pla123a_45980 [Posidoniimonas polymericola]|uniref:GYF domain-containing protein n=2 Tax=Posidoniimonas polymericola TaxID=2528002 RepID=A0A5C5XZ08_9BACT|nr:hypothetical protein Pla123a_45980 [Posidoniimonas polymericola]